MTTAIDRNILVGWPVFVVRVSILASTKISSLPMKCFASLYIGPEGAGPSRHHMDAPRPPALLDTLAGRPILENH
jgi:hypothetical protein